jgi:hypothetical protein
MKIIENSPNQLILRSNPFWQLIFGLIFALAGLAITYFLGRSVDTHCEHTSSREITCTLTEKLFSLVPVGQRTIPNIYGAEVEESRDSDGDTTYKVVFLTNAERVPLTGYTSSGYSSKAEVAEQINQFVQAGRQNSLDIQVKMEWWILIFLVAFGGVGVGIVVFAKTVQIEMNRSEGVLRIQKDGIFGTSRNEFLLREIEDIYLQSSSDSDGTTYRVAFRIAGGEEIPLTGYYSSGYKSKQRDVDLMKDFLSPYQRPQNQDPYS